MLALAASMGDAPVQEQRLTTPLYDYLAEEVFQSVSESFQEQLLALALLPDLSSAPAETSVWRSECRGDRTRS